MAPSAFGLAFFHLGDWCSLLVFLCVIMDRPVRDEHLSLSYNQFQPEIFFTMGPMFLGFFIVVNEEHPKSENHF